jgi:hypothetical protein
MMQTNNEPSSSTPSKELIIEKITDNKDNISDISSSSDSIISTDASGDAIDISESPIIDFKLFEDEGMLRFLESFNFETKENHSSEPASFHSNHFNLAEQSKRDEHDTDDDNCCCGFIYKK